MWQAQSTRSEGGILPDDSDWLEELDEDPEDQDICVIDEWPIDSEAESKEPDY
jgi:hypothetical protein